MVRYGWMKLLLDARAKRSPYDDPGLEEDITRGEIRLPEYSHGKTAEEVTADYLREVHDYAMEKLEKNFGDVLRSTTIKFWLTRPAIWSDEAQIKTLAAAKKAGFGGREGDEIFLITEPEAAAIATMGETEVDFGSRVKVGLAFGRGF
jgi:molecular chaperone DnaK (HSP70)